MRLIKVLIVISQVAFGLCFSQLRAAEGWAKGPDAYTVIGQENVASKVSGVGDRRLSFPSDVKIDPTTGRVFVSDSANHRILRWENIKAYQNGDGAEAVFGQPDFSSNAGAVGAAAMHYPEGIFVDHLGTLWVADTSNHRVLRFDNASDKSSGAAADGAFGQASPDTKIAATTASGMSSPTAIVVDLSGNVFVAEWGNNRVLIFLDGINLAPGSEAYDVLGQPDFVSADAGGGDTGFSQPYGLALDAEENLYVADSYGHRVLRFDRKDSGPDSRTADAVFGQVDFDTNVTGTGNMENPSGLAIDQSGRLWVSDYSNHRILGFQNASTRTNAVAADLLIGQDDFQAGGFGLAANRFHFPKGLGMNAEGHLLVADVWNHRVLAFRPDTFQPDVAIGKTLSKANKGNNVYNVYNGSGSGQKLNYVLRKKKAKLATRLENDSTAPETFAIRAKGTTRKFKINLFTITGGRRNISAAAKLGTYLTPEVAPAETFSLSQELKPKSKFKKRRASIRAWIDATAQTAHEVDRVIGNVKNRP